MVLYRSFKGGVLWNLIENIGADGSIRSPNAKSCLEDVAVASVIA